MTQQQSRFDVIFAEGRKRYERKTGQRCDGGVFAKMTTVSDVRAYVEQENNRFDSFRDRHNTVYERLSAAFTPVERLGSLVATASSAGFPPAGVCLGAAALLIKSAQDVSSHYDNILDLFDILAGILTRLELHSLEQTSPQLEENFANVFATLLEMIGYSAKAIARRRWKEYIARMLHGEDQKIIHLRQRLERLVQDGTSLVVEHIHSNVKSIAKHTTTTAVAVDDIQIKTNTMGTEITDLKGNSRLIMDLLQKQHQSQCDNDIYKILHPSQPNTDKMEGILRDRVAGTGNWLLSEPPFQAWLRRDKSLLWICGAPGCGKTFLASAIISAIQSNISMLPNGWDACTVGFFFLSKNDAHTRIGAFHQALRDVAWQITRLDDNYADNVASQCRSAADIETLPSAWRKLFVGYFGASSRGSLYLVIDGLDEVEEDGEFGRAEFLKLLPYRTSKSGTSKLNINIVLLGRPHLTQSIKVALYHSRSEMATIHIEAHKNKEDLSNFIDHGISRRLQLDGASEDLKNHIRIRIEEKAKGMFLWANLMLEILKWQTTEDDIRDSLRTAPTGIDDMITEMLKVYSSMLKGREAEEFNTILAWLSCSARPLTLAEVDAALRRLSPTANKVLSLEHRLRTTYASLIDVIEDDGLSTASLQSRTSATQHNSIPETTIVTFSHATIAEFFRKDPGKFARCKTAVAIGMIHLEAEMSLLNTCLRVFLAPGVSNWLASSLALESYAKHSWFYHIQSICRLNTLKHVGKPETSRYDTALASDATHAVGMLHTFLDEEDTVRKWSRDIPWEFFDETKCATIAKFVAGMNDVQQLPYPSSTMSWVSKCTEQSETMFLPVAKVHAIEGFHGDWFPLPALMVVAQIKAIAEAGDTLETLPVKLPLDTIMKAAHWISLEQNASWNRKLAVCLRNSGHVTQSITYFERALELDYDYVQARTGLATAYDEQGYLNKVIDLELANTKILIRLLENKSEDEESTVALGRALCVSFEAVAQAYHALDSPTMALKYWRKAAETRHIRSWAIDTYLEVLCEVLDETKWEETQRLLHFLQQGINTEGNCILTAYIHEYMWPQTSQDSFFVMAGTAAQKTGSLDWLVEAYQTAIVSAAAKSHMSVLILKLSLARLYTEYFYDFVNPETLLEEIMEISSVYHAVPIQDLEKCKAACAKDFCRICIRQALESRLEAVEDNQLRRVLILFQSGINPADLSEKIFFGEDTHIYLALLQRMTGAIENAASTLKLYMMECMKLIRGTTQQQRKIGQWMLGVSLLALGQEEEGLALIRHVCAVFGWPCSGCEKIIRGEKVNKDLPVLF